ncbi:MAG: hypothetical protein DMF84_25065 [Acidobacteria bacterium]|nr:MAG: hypothetical protein DMF84_25065 [Acidobacteriota bacterium]
MQLESFGLEVEEQAAEQLQVVAVAQVRPVIHLDALPRIFRHDHEPSIVARRDRAVRAQADRGIQRLRAVVKQVERPDIERAARKIDPRRRGSFDAHALDYRQCSIIS